MKRLLYMAMLSLLPAFAQSSGGEKAKATEKKNNKQNDNKQTKPQNSSPKEENIGTATMTSDGTIVLDLRTKAADGTIGEARFVYAKSHKQYQEILKHLGGLKPGESKAVPPWPDSN